MCSIFLLIDCLSENEHIVTKNFFPTSKWVPPDNNLGGATVKAGTQERGTERETEVRCKVRRK